MLFSAVPAHAIQFRVAGSNPNWVDTGIAVTRGTRIVVTSTGSVNYGTNPTRSDPTRFPGDVNAFGLVIRLTTSRIAHDELHRDFTPDQLRDYCSPYDGWLWLIANDDLPADNIGEYIVDITTGTCSNPDPVDLPATTVRVVQQGTPVPNAEIFIDGRLTQRTDASGRAVFRQLPAGTKILARKLVHEVPGQYRVYLTTATVEDSGAVTVASVVNPNAVQEVAIRSDNALVGLIVDAAVEWDATPTELAAAGNYIRGASRQLYNATDGQFFFEEAAILDNASGWTGTDYRVLANVTLRANSYDAMYMARSDTDYTYGHEYGHYGFGLDDEYSDVDATSCTLNVDVPMSPFAWPAAQSSCLMWNTSPKFCSAHPANPHNPNTYQGPVDCFTAIAKRFRDTASPARWSFRTPVTRGVIPGALPPIPAGWETRITPRNVRAGRLCAVMNVVPLDRVTGAPLADVDVYLQTQTGRTLLMGRTPQDNPGTPANETAMGMSVVGAHPGDRIVAGDTSIDVPFCATDLSASMDGGIPRVASLVAAAQATAPAREKRYLRTGPEPATVLLEPRAKDRAVVSIRFRESVDSASATLTLVGSAKPLPITLKAADKFTWRGDLPDPSAALTGDIVYSGKTSSGKTLEGIKRVRLMQVRGDDRRLEIRSDDGQVSLTPAKGDLPKEAQVAINRIAAAAGPNVIAGPYAIAASHKPNAPATLRFHLAEVIGTAQFDPRSFTIVRLDGGRQVPLPTVRHPEIGVFITRIDRLGTYALTARPKAKTQ